MWQHLAHIAGGGRVTEVNADIDYQLEGTTEYDSLCFLSLRTEHGLLGRVVQDVVSRPPVKRAKIQGTTGAVEWVGGFNSEGDAVIKRFGGQAEHVEVVKKSRPDDFIAEMKYLDTQLSLDEDHPVIGIERGLDTMLVLAASHRSQREGQKILIDYDEGYVLPALKGLRSGR